MKNNVSYIIHGVLALAVIVLFILYFTSKLGGGKNHSGGFVAAMGDSTVALPIAYVNLDSLLIHYNYAKDLNEALMRTEENSRASLVQKERELNVAAQDFQRKLQNNAFLSQERAEQEQQRVMRMQQEYQQLAERLTQEFAVEQQKLNLELADTIKARLKEYNLSKGFEIIFSNTGSDNILFAHPKYDMTPEVIEFLNKKYGPATSAASNSGSKTAEQKK